MRTFLLLAIALLIALTINPAEVSAAITHQGRMTDTGGLPVADGSYPFTFTIYNDPTAGVVRWSSGVRQVEVVQGLFSYSLGDSVPFPDGLFSVDTALWLGITVGPDLEMTPRTAISSSPRALVAGGVDGDIHTSAGRLIVDDNQSNGPFDSTVIIVSEASSLDHRGHVTVLKISNSGSDTTNMVGLYGDPDFPSLIVGDDNSPDSGIVVTNSVDQVRHRGHVTVLKISNNGGDTTNMVGLYGDPDFSSLIVGDNDSPDSGIVVTNAVDKKKYNGHVTVLKISNNGSDTTHMVGLYGDPDFPSLIVGDNDSPDSGIVVTNSVDQLRHRGHVTVLKISNGGADTTEIIGLSGAGDTASLMLNGGGGSGGSIFLQADASASSGKIGVNMPNPTYEVDVVGTICATNGLCQQSDRRLKEKIEPLTDALSSILSLEPVRYSWRREEYPDRHFSAERQIGFIAQDVQSILPEVVSEGTDGYYALDYARLTPVLVEAIQEQQTEIESLTRRLELLEQRMAKLTQTLTVGNPQLGQK